MTIDPLPTPASLGFRKIGRFCTRAELWTGTGLPREADAPRQIDILPGDDESSTACWASTHPMTYLWMAQDDARPLYIGKARTGIAQRMREYADRFAAAGMKSGLIGAEMASAPDHVLAHHIRALWEAGRVLELWARPADSCLLFEKVVTLVSAEEEALLALYEPDWNFPRKIARAANDLRALPQGLICEA